MEENQQFNGNGGENIGNQPDAPNPQNDNPSNGNWQNGTPPNGNWQNGNQQYYNNPQGGNQYYYDNAPQNGMSQYQYNPPQNVPPMKDKPGLAIGGFVVSIVALLTFFVGFATYWSWLFGLILSITGVVLSALGIKSSKKGLAIAGLVISIICLIVNGILFISCGLCAAAALGAVGAFA